MSSSNDIPIPGATTLSVSILCDGFSTVNIDRDRAASATAIVNTEGLITSCSKDFAYLCDASQQGLIGTEVLELAKFESPSDAQEACFRLQNMSKLDKGNNRADISLNLPFRASNRELVESDYLMTVTAEETSDGIVLMVSINETSWSEKRRSRSSSLAASPHSRNSSIGNNFPSSSSYEESDTSPLFRSSFKVTGDSSSNRANRMSGSMQSSPRSGRGTPKTISSGYTSKSSSGYGQGFASGEYCPAAALRKCNPSPVEILIVDSNKTSLLNMSCIVNHAGHLVTVATSGEEALGLLEVKSFHIAYVNVHLNPSMSGLDMMKFLELKSSRGGGDKPLPPFFALVDNWSSSLPLELSTYGFEGQLITPLTKEKFNDTFLSVSLIRAQSGSGRQHK